MKFLNSQPQFDEFLTEDYQFYIKGKTNVDRTTILTTLRDGKFPNNLKGNFAFYFSDKNRIVVAVDHLPNFQMFYNEHFCGHIFTCLRDEMVKKQLRLTDNPVVLYQKSLFGESVGDETTVKEIKIVPPGCYLEITPDKNNKIVQHNNVYSHSNKDFNLEELSSIIENFIKENTQQPFGLLLSSGRDSNTIFGLFRKLGIADQCSFISIKGEPEFRSEAPYIEKIAEHYGISIDWQNFTNWHQNDFQKIDDPGFQSAYKRSYPGFWCDPHFLAKYYTIRKLGHENKTIFTGEVGDQIFGSNAGKIFLKFILQNPNCDVEELADLFLCCDISRFKPATKLKDFNAFLYLRDVSASYNRAKQWFIETWNKIEIEDLVNKIELLHYYQKASYRVYNYSQLYDLKFANPYADGYLFDYIWSIPGHYKISDGGRTRNLSYNLVKDYMVDWPWKWSKTGPGILSNEYKFENFKGTYNAIQMVLGKHTR
jgi:asparagine synthetase B (glutamine-hydrolysing)